ncbi:TPA: 50S ribosomal protein L19 [Patescibacteria group bacterium]|nr:50S ribosomal protein L19 [Patescibacteria group bacterium]
MTTQEVISPVNIEARKELGVRSGDTVRVTQKIKEKGKVRLQVFEGLVLMVKHGTEAGATFTVRKVASGVGVEKTFPLYSPMIDKIEIVKRTKVRRAKLYYIREKATKEIRRAMRKAFAMGTSIESDTTEKERIVKEASAKVATEEAEKKRMEELASAEATASKEEIPVEPALASEETPAEETK